VWCIDFLDLLNIAAGKNDIVPMFIDGVLHEI